MNKESSKEEFNSLIGILFFWSDANIPDYSGNYIILDYCKKYDEIHHSFFVYHFELNEKAEFFLEEKQILVLITRNQKKVINTKNCNITYVSG